MSMAWLLRQWPPNPLLYNANCLTANTPQMWTLGRLITGHFLVLYRQSTWEIPLCALYVEELTDSRAWWYMPLIPLLRRLQAEFKASLAQTVTSRLARATLRTRFKERKKIYSLLNEKTVGMRGVARDHNGRRWPFRPEK